MWGGSKSGLGSDEEKEDMNSVSAAHLVPIIAGQTPINISSLSGLPWGAGGDQDCLCVSSFSECRDSPVKLCLCVFLFMFWQPVDPVVGDPVR